MGAFRGDDGLVTWCHGRGTGRADRYRRTGAGTEGTQRPLQRGATVGRQFDERSAAVTAATTRGDLDKVFADLSSPEPEPEPPVSRRSYDWRAALLALTPIVALVLFFVFHTWLWFLLIPAVSVLLSVGQFKRG